MGEVDGGEIKDVGDLIAGYRGSGAGDGREDKEEREVGEDKENSGAGGGEVK